MSCIGGITPMDKFNYDEVVKLCRTCAKATVISITGDYLCVKRGIVKHDNVCKKYKLNESLPRPSKRRLIDTSKFDASEFKV